MPEPYIGEIRMFAGNFAPAGWAFCDGQLIPISENDALFTLIGTTYGGDGQNNFALPNLQSRLPMHAGTGPGGITRQLAETGGVESVTLSANQIPTHTHAPACNDPGTNSGNSASPGGNVWANQASTGLYTNAFNPQVVMSPQALSSTGGSLPHENMMPFLVITFILSLFGVFPSQT